MNEVKSSALVLSIEAPVPTMMALFRQTAEIATKTRRMGHHTEADQLDAAQRDLWASIYAVALVNGTVKLLGRGGAFDFGFD